MLKILAKFMGFRIFYLLQNRGQNKHTQQCGYFETLNCVCEITVTVNSVGLSL